MDARIASIEDDGEFLVEMDGEGVTRSLSIESSGAWDQFITQSFNGIFLEEGKQTLTIKFDGKYFHKSELYKFYWSKIQNYKETYPNF